VYIFPNLIHRKVLFLLFIAKNTGGGGKKPKPAWIFIRRNRLKFHMRERAGPGAL